MPWAVDLTGQFFDDLSVVDLQQRPWTGKGNHPDIPSSRLGFLKMGHLWAHGHPKFKRILVFPCFWTH